MKLYASIFKPLFDVLIALTAFIILLPVFLLLVVLLFIANSGKPFFFQKRPGKNGAIFNVIKFKTMNDRRDASGNLLPDADRLTAVGSFVRRTSLDEIPQLLNVIIGDMSLVGPRPLLIEYLPLYNDIQRQRHNAKPGITGWAQINGRNAISWKQKFEYDVWYVQNLSFILDIKILLLTIKRVIKKDGISQDGEATMSKFKG